jgi:hypothetical protein
MKEILRPFLMLWVKFDVAFVLFKPFILLFNFISRERKIYEQNPDLHAIDKIISRKEVLAGPFKGLKYPSVKAFGSAIYPKIVGSYESFLNPVIEKAIEMEFSDVIQIGSAEGYFTIGLSMRMPNSRIRSYEIDSKARKYQQAMAEYNGIGSQLEILELCTEKTLAEAKFDRSGLVICDCEGCEKTMFSLVNKENLKNWYLIIETHSMNDLTIPEVLRKHFSETHEIKTILSEDDFVKAGTFMIPEMKGLDIATRKRLITEYRENIQEYLILSPKGKTPLA